MTATKLEYWMGRRRTLWAGYRNAAAANRRDAVDWLGQILIARRMIREEVKRCRIARRFRRS